jgi:proton-dependent oligopeptide transporter, POT family
MFKGQPRGLFVLALSNMGERFGYYTMLAIFTLFLQDRFGWDGAHAASLYGIFLAGIYFLPMLGGIIADAGFGYGKTAITGIIIMFLGYIVLWQANVGGELMLYFSLGIIALGVGLFKGNMVVIVGNLYEKAENSKYRDAAFNIYYMFINIGAFFAPYMAVTLKNAVMGSRGFTYDPAIPRIANDVIANKATPEQVETITKFASGSATDLTQYAHNYIDSLSAGYSYGFLAAGICMLLSLSIFLIFRKTYKDADYLHKNKKKDGAPVVELTKKQTRDRVFALILVFIIVIFFWMAFHQNGSTLTSFARSYTNLQGSHITSMWFYLPTILSFFAFVFSLLILFNKNSASKSKIIASIVAFIGLCIMGGFLYYQSVNNPGGTARLDPELFQSFNPLFVVFLTPIVIGLFSILNKKGKEPSPPKKIGLGMIITTIGFTIMFIASLGLPSVKALGSNAISALPEFSGMAVSPYWLISTYFTLTIAELFLSPMGLSFVAKIAPPKIKGTMQAGWLAATAVGNYAAGAIGKFYQNWELWQFFLFIMIIAITSAIIMFSILKIVNRAAQS